MMIVRTRAGGEVVRTLDVVPYGADVPMSPVQRRTPVNRLPVVSASPGRLILRPPDALWSRMTTRYVPASRVVTAAPSAARREDTPDRESATVRIGGGGSGSGDGVGGAIGLPVSAAM